MGVTAEVPLHISNLFWQVNLCCVPARPCFEYLTASYSNLLYGKVGEEVGSSGEFKAESAGNGDWLNLLVCSL